MDEFQTYLNPTAEQKVQMAKNLALFPKNKLEFMTFADLKVLIDRQDGIVDDWRKTVKDEWADNISKHSGSLVVYLTALSRLLILKDVFENKWIELDLYK